MHDKEKEMGLIFRIYYFIYLFTLGLKNHNNNKKKK